MSSATKIVVFKLKELVITGVLALLAVILFILFIIHITSGSAKKNADDTLSTFTPGIYTASIMLSGNTMEEQVRQKGSTDGITYSADAKYTSLVLINAIDTALDKARK